MAIRMTTIIQNEKENEKAILRQKSAQLAAESPAYLAQIALIRDLDRTAQGMKKEIEKMESDPAVKRYLDRKKVRSDIMAKIRSNSADAEAALREYIETGKTPERRAEERRAEEESAGLPDREEYNRKHGMVYHLGVPDDDDETDSDAE